mmetsp:Transcript_26634/g.41507  ORF Transcript_26634/g.41507 Transcript_26634/m.41507 type:complete len:80 (+) Transcript_26634:35-274(+)
MSGASRLTAFQKALSRKPDPKNLQWDETIWGQTLIWGGFFSVVGAFWKWGSTTQAMRERGSFAERYRKEATAKCGRRVI